MEKESKIQCSFISKYENYNYYDINIPIEIIKDNYLGYKSTSVKKNTSNNKKYYELKYN